MALAHRSAGMGRRGEPAGRNRAARRGEAPGGGAVARGLFVVGGVIRLVARLVMLVALIAAGVIVAAIVLRVLDASAGNTIVKAVHDAGRTLVGPFHNVFGLRQPKASIAVNWGLAAVVYLIVGALIARLLRRLAPMQAGPVVP